MWPFRRRSDDAFRREILWFAELRQDGRYALRTLWRSPGFAAVAILTLGLGIGANTAIFSVVNAVVLRPLPYRDPASLVVVDTSPVPLADSWLTAAWRDRAKTLSDFGGFNGPTPATLVAGGEPEQVLSAFITWNFLSLLGVGPKAGRDFTEGDGSPGATPVALLSHNFWIARFGGDPSIVGRTVTVSGAVLTVVGVTPATFRFPAAGALSAAALQLDTQPDVMRVAGPAMRLNVIGRLAPAYRHAPPPRSCSGSTSRRPRVCSTTANRNSRNRRSIDCGLASDCCMNDSPDTCASGCGSRWGPSDSFFWSRARTLRTCCWRERRRVTGSWLSARRWGAPRKADAPAVDRECAAGALRIGPRSPACRLHERRGAARAGGSSAAHRHDCARLVGARVYGGGRDPHRHVVRPGVHPWRHARQSDRRLQRRHASRDRTEPMRRVLLSTEIAMTFVLVVGAALLVQTLWILTTKDHGFEADRLLTVRVSPGIPRDLDRSDHRAASRYFAVFFSDLRDRLERIPGVASAGAVSRTPLAGTVSRLANITLDGHPAGESSTPIAFVTPAYFRTLRIPVIAGRDFDERDRLGAERVVIVNEAFQRRFAPDGNVVGARMTAIRRGIPSSA